MLAAADGRCPVTVDREGQHAVARVAGKEIRPLFQFPVMLADRPVIAVVIVQQLTQDQKRAAHRIGGTVAAPERRRVADRAGYEILRMGDVLHELFKKAVRSEVVHRRLGTRRQVIEPALPLGPLAAVRRDRVQVRPLRPQDVLLQAGDQRVGTGEPSALGQVAVHHDAGDIIGAKALLRPGHADIAEPVVGELRLIDHVVPGQDHPVGLHRQRIRRVGNAQILHVQRAVVPADLGIPQRDLMSRRTGQMRPHHTGEVLPEVDHDLPVRQPLQRNGAHLSGRPDRLGALRRDPAARRGHLQHVVIGKAVFVELCRIIRPHGGQIVAEHVPHRPVIPLRKCLARQAPRRIGIQLVDHLTGIDRGGQDLAHHEHPVLKIGHKRHARAVLTFDIAGQTERRMLFPPAGQPHADDVLACRQQIAHVIRQRIDVAG